MHNQRKHIFHHLGMPVRLVLIFMLIMPTFSPTGIAQARGLMDPSATGVSAGSLRGIENANSQLLPFSQNWTDTSLITISDDWSNVPGIVGYRGDDLTTSTGTDPQTLLMDGTTTPVDVNANQTTPNTYTTGGVTEFHLTDSVVALTGSGTADAPFLLIFINSQGFNDIQISYKLRDLESGADNAIQQVALHYRLGSTGDFTNLSAGYVADATIGNATMETLVSVTLPSTANDQPLIQLRVMTTNAVGNDEWVGVDDISITGTAIEPEPKLQIEKSGPTLVDVNQAFYYSLSVVNSLGMTATQVVITDSLPISVTFQSASDGGVLIDTNVVSWTVPTLDDGATAIRTVTVAAPTAPGTLINYDYGVWSSNWLTRTVGISVTTTVRDPDIVTIIADARAAGPGWYGTIQGNVTVVPGTFATLSFAIQDETGGLYIYPQYGAVLPPMVLGDQVRVKGTIVNFNNLLEMNPVTSVTWIDSGTVPDPLVTLTGNVGLTQGKLIQIQGTALSMTGSTNKTILFNDGSGQTTVYVYGTTGIDLSSFTFPMPMRVTGMSGAYNSPQVNPRYQSDMVDLRPPTVISTNPADASTGVNPYRPLYATFSKPMDALTINPASFTLTGSSGLVGGDVNYDATSRTTSFTPSEALSPLSTYTATLTTEIKDIYNIPMDSAYTWSFTTGDADTTPPEIVGRFPEPDQTDVSLRASVGITFTEDLHPSSLDLSHFSLEGPYGIMPSTFSYNPTTFIVTLDPDTRLLPTTLYTVTVKGTTSDWAGNTLGSDVVWSFETQVEPPMNVYFGDIHNHTSYSDGSGTPAQALAAGEAAGFDFMAISDHSYAIDDSEWLDTLTAVDAATDLDFVALRGFEYTQGAEGHINVYNTERHAVRTNTGCAYCDYTPNLEAGVTVQGFYEWAAITGTVGIDTAGTVLQFNHPGWINFNDWTYHPEVSDIARLEEVGNGNGSSYAFSEDEYIRSLDYGWRVGATNNGDTHTTYWGTNTDHRTGVLMSELTKEALLESLRERKTFATEDINYALRMKANGAWMGSEIANSDTIQFEIDGIDPDGELTILVQIITDQGKVAEQLEPYSSSFVWSPLLNIPTGVQYFYIKVTQEDGDRIVSSPVWTLGSEDIAVTDVIIQPSIPTIYSPSLLTARLTNRNNAARPVSVTMDINGVYLEPSVDVLVPGNGDVYANFSWQPVITGEVTVTAHIIGAPAGDNPNDNEGILNLTVTDEQLPLVLIDAGHGNLNASGREMRMFIDDLSNHQYNVLKNLDELTTSDLDSNVVKLLIITAPQYAYTSAELSAISEYVAVGGSLWLLGLSDYTGKEPWAATVSNRENAILEAIETRIGSQINMRMNDDEIIDGNTNNGYVFGVIWGDFPAETTSSIGLNVEALASWSLNSIRGRNVTEPLTPNTPDVQIVVQGDLDEGYTGDSWHNPYHTSNTDADGAGDAYIYNPSWVYPNPPPPDPIRVPMSAITQLPNGAGRIMLYGDSSDPFTTFAYTSGDGKQNELFNLEAIMWLLDEPLEKSTIAEARAQTEVNQPDKLDRLVWIEGEITAAYGEFFNVLYVQDETGGITVHAPAGDIDPSSYTRGTLVRAVGTVGIYNGDTEIEFFEAEMVQVLSPAVDEPVPMPMSTYQASLEENQGWLDVITGTVTTKVGIDNIFIDDGSGPVRIFLDGYNGDFSDIQVNDLVRIIGLVSEDGDGHRIRVRNHGMHPEYADDVVKLPQVLELTISKDVSTPETILPGSPVTYTVILSNSGTGTVLQTSLTDTLPAGVTFGGFISNDGAVEQGGTISWTGNMPIGMEVNLVFTATVDSDYNLYGETITNTVEYTAPYAGSGSASTAFAVAGAPDVSIDKGVSVPGWLNPGDEVTYTLSISNTGEAPGLNLAMTDTLPEGINFGGWILQNGAVEENGVITWEGDLPSEREFIFTAIVDYDHTDYGHPITNTVEFTSTNAGSGSAEAAFTIGTPVLNIEKAVETMHDPALPGDPITYTIEIQNDSTAGAVGVHIWDILPDEVMGNDVDVTTNINANSSYTITVPATLAPDVMLGSTINNIAYYENGDLFGESSASFTVWAGEPILSINKTVETMHDPAHPGDPITYTIVVQNDGTANAVDTHIWDTLPDEVIGDNVDITVTINTGTAYTITIPAFLSPDAGLGSTIINTAYFESGDLSGEASTSFTVWAGEPILSIAKYVETAHDPVRPNEPITYTIVVRNDGNADALDVHIWDMLPEYVIGNNADITVTINAGTAYTITIPATLATDVVRGLIIINTAYYEYGNLSGNDSISFLVAGLNKIYLPLIRRY